MSKNKKLIDEEPDATGGKDASMPRREVLKRSVVVGGVTVAVSEWAKPIVESVVLPAHAQTSVVIGGSSSQNITFP